MYSDKQRVASYLKTSISEIDLIEQMAAPFWMTAWSIDDFPFVIVRVQFLSGHSLNRG